MLIPDLCPLSYFSVSVLSFAVRYFVLMLVLQSSPMGKREMTGCFALFVFLVSRYCFVALPRDAMGLSTVCGVS